MNQNTRVNFTIFLLIPAASVIKSSGDFGDGQTWIATQMPDFEGTAAGGPFWLTPIQSKTAEGVSSSSVWGSIFKHKRIGELAECRLDENILRNRRGLYRSKCAAAARTLCQRENFFIDVHVAI